MNKEIVKRLHEEAIRLEKVYSNPDREFNYNMEEFDLIKLKPLSENVAYGLYLKRPSNKIALVCFYHIRRSGGVWEHFFPQESHIYGLLKLAPLLQEIEEHNFDRNGTYKEEMNPFQQADNLKWQNKKWESAIKK